MKTLFAALAALCLPLAVLAAPAPDEDTAKGKEVKYDVHAGHFEKNNAGLKGDASYLDFTDREGFDKVFGAGFTMGKKPNVVPKDAFDKKMVVAVIKRGNAITTYKVEKVTADDGTLYVQYTAKAGDAGTAKYASPLIVSVDKGDYKSVVFLENGKKVATEKVAKPKAEK